MLLHYLVKYKRQNISVLTKGYYEQQM